MAKLSDSIENIIKQMIEENDGVIEITRGDLANRVNCVPSQITYVLSKRFTNSHGYYVESRRGGGGWIRIERVQFTSFDPVKEKGINSIISSIAGEMSQQDAWHHLSSFSEIGLINDDEANIIYAAVLDNTLTLVDKGVRERVRSSILKAMLIKAVIQKFGK